MDKGEVLFAKSIARKALLELTTQPTLMVPKSYTSWSYVSRYSVEDQVSLVETKLIACNSVPPS